MSVRRTIVTAALITMTAVIFFTLGEYSAERLLVRQHAEGDGALTPCAPSCAHSGHVRTDAIPSWRAAFSERTVAGEHARPRSPGQRSQTAAARRNGTLSCQLLRERRESFVELYAYDNLRQDQLRYGGYLGNGYFITVKHGVMALPDDAGDPPAARRSNRSV